MGYEDNVKDIRGAKDVLSLLTKNTTTYKVVEEILKGTPKSEIAKKLGIAEVELRKYVWEVVHRRMGKVVKKVQPIYNKVTAKPVSADHPLSKYVPQTDGYVARNVNGTTDVKLVSSLYDNRDFLLIVGPCGSGKTHLVRHICFEKKVPYVRVALTGATTPEDLVGQWIPNNDPTNPAKYKWVDGKLTMFMRYGGVFVVDEMNMCPADILSLFHSVADDERRLVLTQKDGEVIHAHPDFWLVSTINPSNEYEGTKPLNRALQDRFHVLYQGYSEAVEKKLGVDDKIADIADKLRKSSEISTPVSTRDLLRYNNDTAKYGERVARAFFVANFESHEQNVVTEIFEMLVDGKAKLKPNEDIAKGNGSV